MDSHEMIRQLVKCYETKRLLWDSKHPDYYNKNKREDLWREISQSMNVSVKDLKKKMTSLLGSYRRERSREKKSQVTGSGQGDVYKSKWFAYTWLHFLSDKDMPNDTFDTMDNDVIDSFGSIKGVSDDSIDEDTATELQITGSEVQKDQNLSCSGATNRLTVSKRKQANNIVKAVRKHSKHATDALQIICENPKEAPAVVDDECSLYGKLIAEKLKTLSYRSRLIVQNKIDNWIFEAQLKEMNTPSALSSPYDNSGPISTESSVASTPLCLPNYK